MLLGSRFGIRAFRHHQSNELQLVTLKGRKWGVEGFPLELPVSSEERVFDCQPNFVDIIEAWLGGIAY